MLENTIALSIKIDGEPAVARSYKLDNRNESEATSEYLDATSTDESPKSLLHTRRRGTRNGNFRGTNRSKVTFKNGLQVAGQDPASLVRAQAHITTEAVTPVGISREQAAELIALQVAYMQTEEYLAEVVLGCQY